MVDNTLKTFRIHWFTGKSVDCKGINVADAFARLGYGSGVVLAVDWYEEIPSETPPLRLYYLEHISAAGDPQNMFITADRPSEALRPWREMFVLISSSAKMVSDSDIVTISEVPDVGRSPQVRTQQVIATMAVGDEILTRNP